MGVEIDRCVNCGGIWLDAGELKALVANRPGPGTDAQLEATIDQLSRARPTDTVPRLADVASTACPACAGKLTIVNFADSHIEQCNGCHGVFVDRGELAKAMKLVDSSEATTIMALAKSVTTTGSIGG